MIGQPGTDVRSRSRRQESPPTGATEKPENWATCHGFPDYEVSDQGSVRRKAGTGRGHTFIDDSQSLSAWSGGRRDDHRPRVRLYRRDPKTNRRRGHDLYVHVLVLEAFVCPRPPGAHACHNNGESGDNRLVNLRWDSASANMVDLQLPADYEGNLSAEQVRRIRLQVRHTVGLCFSKLAQEHKVPRWIIQWIYDGRAFDPTQPREYDPFDDMPF